VIRKLKVESCGCDNEECIIIAGVQEGVEYIVWPQCTASQTDRPRDRRTYDSIMPIADHTACSSTIG